MDWRRENSFIKINKIVSRDILLSYPNFSEEFIIHACAIKIQLKRVIRKNGKPVSFYLHKLTKAQLVIRLKEDKC